MWNKTSKKDIKKINEKINEFLDNLTEEEPSITFYVDDRGTRVQSKASEYDMLNFILNFPQIALTMLDEMEIEDDLQLKIVKARLECIHDYVGEIYKKFNESWLI